MALNWIEGVLKHSKHTGTDLLLLVLLAESADRDTGTCYPGRKTLARLMRSSERTVQRTIQVLIDSGEMSVKLQGSPLGTNLYTLSAALLRGDKNVSLKEATETGGDEIVSPYGSRGDESVSPGGDRNVAGGETEMSPKPSVEPSVVNRKEKPSVSRKARLPDHWCLSDQDREYAASEGLSVAEIEAEAEDFRDYWLAKGDARMDWAASWRSWVRKSKTFNRPRAPSSNGSHKPSLRDKMDQWVAEAERKQGGQ